MCSDVCSRFIALSADRDERKQMEKDLTELSAHLQARLLPDFALELSALYEKKVYSFRI